MVPATLNQEARLPEAAAPQITANWDVRANPLLRGRTSLSRRMNSLQQLFESTLFLQAL